MTQQRRTALKELQKLDDRIQETRKAIASYDPKFEEVENPALALESDLGTSQKRLKEMKLEERRLESSTQEKEERLRRLEDRLGGVRNLREEAAVTAELDMVRRALQSDEAEALGLIDSVRRMDERVAELETALAEANAIVKPKLEGLIAERDQVKEDLVRFEKEREAFASGMDAGELKIYNAIRGRGGRAAVAELTADGACGHCFGMVPLQSQNEIRHGESLIRCEACGVIIAAPEPVPEEEPADEVSDDAVEADGEATDESDGEAGADSEDDGGDVAEE